MSKSLVIRLAVAAAASCASLAASAACTIVSTPFGPRFSDCTLEALSKGKLAGELQVMQRQPVLVLPNLVVTDTGFWVNGGGVTLSMEVQNVSSGMSAGPFDMLMMATVHNPLAANAMVGGVTTLPAVTVPRLVAGASARASLGWLGVPNRNQDWDICTVAIVDPVAANGPAQGRVREGNEGDNQSAQCCRVYGPIPT